jgi:ABC-2 type transport system permease protein
MKTTFLTTVKILTRTPSIIIFCLGLPLILSCMFMFMFTSLVNDGTIDPVPVAVVASEDWKESTFADVVDGLAEQGDDQLLSVTEVATHDEGEQLVLSAQVAGMYEVDSNGEPTLTVLPDGAATDSTTAQINTSILESVANGYVENSDLIESYIEDNPLIATEAGELERIIGLDASVKQVSLTRSVPDETVRYYYALFAMAAMFAGLMSASVSLSRAQPNITTVGARRSVAGTSRLRLFGGLVLGSWVISTACGVLIFLFVRFVVGMDFQGREGLCLVGIAAANLVTTGIGALIGSFPFKGGDTTRSGITIIVALVSSMFAGLFGTGSMEVADIVALAAPAEPWLNPARLTADLFYSLYFYESLAPFALRLAACLAMAAVLLVVAMLVFRRQRYEYL